MNTKINLSDIKWLEEEFPKYKGRSLKGDVLVAYYQAERILKNNPTIQKRNCTCEHGGLKSDVERLYKAYLND